MNGTLRSWIHYIELRGANGTQKEHIEIAQACAKVISEVFPIMEALIKLFDEAKGVAGGRGCKSHHLHQIICIFAYVKELLRACWKTMHFYITRLEPNVVNVSKQI